MNTLSPNAKKVFSQINSEKTKLGDLRKIAKEIKKDHNLAMELLATKEFYPQQLALLIMDNKLIDQDFINTFEEDISHHNENLRNQLTDWFMANQLTKSKKTIALIESWENSKSIMQRRIFWYYQARLRWTGKTNFSDTKELLDSIEKKIGNESSEVQWAMNFLAGWIGVFDVENRARCIAI